MTTIRVFSPKIGHFFPICEKGQGVPPLPSPLVTRLWTILNRLLYNKNLLTTPPLLVNGKFVSDFCEKGNIFSNFFASICTHIDNASCLPSFS